MHGHSEQRPGHVRFHATFETPFQISQMATARTPFPALPAKGEGVKLV
jgi:hypothetical protein